jgi:transposase
MQTITTIGLDIAKSVFQVHGVDAGGEVVVRRQLKRRYVLAFFQKLPACLVGIEACASSHHWSRELFGQRDPLRVHNSGHWMLDGASISQFEQHIRAIAG